MLASVSNETGNGGYQPAAMNLRFEETAGGSADRRPGAVGGDRRSYHRHPARGGLAGRLHQLGHGQRLLVRNPIGCVA